MYTLKSLWLLNVLSLKLPQPQAIRIAREMFNFQEYFVETLFITLLKSNAIKNLDKNTIQTNIS